MAVDKLVDSAQLNADLTSVANAIRTKGGTSASLAFPAGFVSAVNAIPTGGGDLPDIYREVEYINTGNGDPYIKTNYTPTNGDNLHFIFQNNAERTTTQTFYTLISAGKETYQFIVMFGLWLRNNDQVSDSIYWKHMASGAAPSVTMIELVNDAWYIADSIGDTLTVKGNTLTSAYESALDGTDTSLYVGCRANLGNPFHGKFGRIQITNDGKLKLNLIPCYRKQDNVIGMYDSVSDTFYTNSGTGSFTKGIDILTDAEAINVLLGGA